jgi:hypothetical protein
MEYNGQNNALKKTARIISVAFHPLLMPLYGMLIIFTAPTFFWYVPLRIKLTLLLIVMTDTILIPVSLLPFFMHRNIIKILVPGDKKRKDCPTDNGLDLLYCDFIYFRKSADPNFH